MKHIDDIAVVVVVVDQDTKRICVFLEQRYNFQMNEIYTESFLNRPIFFARIIRLCRKELRYKELDFRKMQKRKRTTISSYSMKAHFRFSSKKNWKHSILSHILHVNVGIFMFNTVILLRAKKWKKKKLTDKNGYIY